MNARFAFLLLLGLLGCSAPRVARTIPQRTQHIVLNGTERSRTWLLPVLGAPVLLSRESEQDAYYLVGGVRVQLRAGRPVVAQQAFVEPPVGVQRVRGGWRFRTAAGAQWHATEFVGTMRREETPRGGTLAPIPAIERTLQAPAEEGAAVARAALERFAWSRVTLASATPLEGGLLAFRTDEAVTFVSSAEDQLFSARGRVVLPAEARECTARSWGERLLLRCRDRLWQVDPRGAQALGRISDAGLLLGREGRTITQLGPCPEEGEQRREPPNNRVARACTWERERGWREWEYPRAGTIVDVYDDRALVVETIEDALTLFVYDIDLARVTPAVFSDPTALLSRVGFTPDGRIAVLSNVGRAGQQRSLVGVSEIGRTITLRSLGFLAADFAMADERRGLAIGPTAGEVAASTDGGFSWNPLLVTSDGDPGSISLVDSAAVRSRAPVQRVGDSLECVPELCRVSRLLHRWGEVLTQVPAVL